MSLYHRIMAEPPDQFLEQRQGEFQTVYDLLRRLVSGDVWREEERREAIALVTELEANNVLGNRAREITIREGGDK